MGTGHDILRSPEADGMVIEITVFAYQWMMSVRLWHAMFFRKCYHE